jgi:hypothetical protein
MTEQNRRYVTKEIGKLLSEIWRSQGPGGAGVRAAAPHRQEARHHARGGTETAAGLTAGRQPSQKLFRIPHQALPGVRGIFQYRKGSPLLTPVSLIFIS